ncbi:MAG TPA: pitrilysin family protein [Bacteroidales bacterium]|nr:peptidase M16 [Bacteroidales bacterium]HOU96229.1 pitrilysin family protein [Bacteroidales bacterium]HQG36955.1 pitrilysin family protein [Bacteroidales bacterium]HQG52036.1 pitrilysin family protein [Bacteroidales bacterium]HQJ21209.1 pitrilysin family protein [Bacteroidales bacterium]
MDIISYTLRNGIRVIHYPVKNMVTYCGLVIGAGSKNESDSEQGLAHLTEHMLFKGTSTRKAYHILSRLEDVGGELNAYTTKEETAIHASVLNCYFERAVELICDIAFNSVFPPKEIEKEKDVIIEEINSCRDNPSELIFDDFEDIIFKNQPLGRNILGTKETVRSFERKDIQSFVNKNYCTDKMVFCSVGNISAKEVIRLTEKYLGEVQERTSGDHKYNLPDYTPVNIQRNIDTWQTHCIIGNIAYNIFDKRRIGMYMLNNILGGQGLNSRLNISLREKNGFAYNIESTYNPYYETGVFSIYFGTDNGHLDKSIAIAHKELNKLRSVRLGSLQLSKAKKQIKGYLARGYENYEGLMLSLGKSMLVFNRIEMPDEIYEKVDAVTADELLEIACEMFDENSLSTLIYK